MGIVQIHISTRERCARVFDRLCFPISVFSSGPIPLWARFCPRPPISALSPFSYQILLLLLRLRVSFFPLVGSPRSLSLSPLFALVKPPPSSSSSPLFCLLPPFPPPPPLSLSLQSDSSRGARVSVSACCVFGSLLSVGFALKAAFLLAAAIIATAVRIHLNRSKSHSSLLLSFGCYNLPFTLG